MSLAATAVITEHAVACLLSAMLEEPGDTLQKYMWAQVIHTHRHTHTRTHTRTRTRTHTQRQGRLVSGWKTILTVKLTSGVASHVKDLCRMTGS